MSLRWKILVFVCGVSAAFAIIAIVVQQMVTRPGFEAVEVNQAADDLVRCKQALERDCRNMESVASDYARWDATVRYLQGEEPGYPAENFVPETFRNQHLNVIAVFATDGHLVWGEARQNNVDETLPADEFLSTIAQPDHPLVGFKSRNERVSGLLITPLGALILGACPVTMSDGSGPIRGSVVMGRLLDDDAVAELAERTRVTCTLTDVNKLSAQRRAMLSRVQERGSAQIERDDPHKLHAYAAVHDIYGQPAMLLEVEMPRTITKRGDAAASLAACMALGSGIVIMLAMWLLLSRWVVDPLTHVTKHAVAVGANNNLLARLNMQSNDEVGTLARELDRMVDRLEESRAQMLEVARHAGMAQVATDVLHNVGNVLNSVNVSAGLVNESLRRSEAPTLSLAAKLLNDHRSELATFLTQDERGRQLPGFLTQLAETLTGEQAAMQKEMQVLADAVEHIRRIVDMQQVHSKCNALREAVDIEELVAQARSLSAESFGRHHIHVSTRFEPIGPLEIDRHKTLQILVNVLRNAKQALVESQQTDRCVEIDVTRGAAERGDVLRIRVIDNGVGIAPENLERIFAFGFSTRSRGHGYGLHSAANMAREMGGSLHAASDGPARGAVFTLELPLIAAEVSA